MSKRCCPVCASLLSHLNKPEDDDDDAAFKFVVSDEHSNITACPLPEWLSEKKVYTMVVEFSRRLRVELKKLQDASTSRAGGHYRTKTTDTARLSINSDLSQDYPESDEDDKQIEAFTKPIQKIAGSDEEDKQIEASTSGMRQTT